MHLIMPVNCYVNEAEDFLYIRDGAQEKLTSGDKSSQSSATAGLFRATSVLSSSGFPMSTVNNVLKAAFSSHLTLLHQMK